MAYRQFIHTEYDPKASSRHLPTQENNCNWLELLHLKHNLDQNKNMIFSDGFIVLYIIHCTSCLLFADTNLSFKNAWR